MAELELKRLFSDPDPSGVMPRRLAFSPDGKRVTWLAGSDADAERLDLWQYDVDSGDAGVLVAAAQLETSARELSDQEKARRERKRIFSKGIVEYHWHPDGSAVLFPLDGLLYLHRIETGQTECLTADDTDQTDVRFSPDGRWISFVRQQDLHVMDLASGATRRLTTDGGGTVSNGLAEFIAAEEMHRYEGYWWSPDSRRLAFVQVDEAPVDVTHRFEIQADEVTVIDQRYPFAGKTNARVRVGIAELDGNIHWPPVDREESSYVARVDWFADSLRLAVQVQSRDQQQLDLLEVAPDSDSRTILTETSESWINLHDHLRTLDDGSLLWGSERTGYAHLYRLDPSTGSACALTEGEWVVKAVRGVDEKHVWFEGTQDTPIETHLYVVPLDGNTPPRRITRTGLNHSTTVSKDCKLMLDHYSAPDQPPAIDLCQVDGTLVKRICANDLGEGHPMFPYICPKASNVHFGSLHADDGQELHYRLMEPTAREDGKRYPVIVTVYGGPGVQRVTREWIPPWHHYMTRRGYGLMQLDNRGSSNRGKRFESPIYGRMGDVEVRDQLTGAEFLKTLPWVDSDRLGVFGHSYGGYMTLQLLMRGERTFRAGVSVAPVTDWHLYDTHYTERFLGQPTDNTEGYRLSGVLPWIDGLQGRLLLIHGMADDNVLFTHTTLLMRALQDADVDFELMTYPGEKHGLASRATNLHRYGLMDRFFDRWLGAGAR